MEFHLSNLLFITETSRFGFWRKKNPWTIPNLNLSPSPLPPFLRFRYVSFKNNIFWHGFIVSWIFVSLTLSSVWKEHTNIRVGICFSSFNSFVHNDFMLLNYKWNHFTHFAPELCSNIGHFFRYLHKTTIKCYEIWVYNHWTQKSVSKVMDAHICLLCQQSIFENIDAIIVNL